jgi:hypothetical protein
MLAFYPILVEGQRFATIACDFAGRIGAASGADRPDVGSPTHEAETTRFSS